MQDVCWALRRISLPKTYVLDKLLTDRLLPSADILKDENIYTIFLIRNPANALKSIFALHNKVIENETGWNVETTLNYYIKRLSSLEEYARIIEDKNRCFFLTYEQLIEKNNLVFEKLRAFLKVDLSFSNSYKLMRTTGIPGIGDRSSNLKKKRIMKKLSSIGEGIEISEDVLKEALKKFNQCKESLQKYCITI